MSGRIAAYQEGYTDGFNDACEKYNKWGKWRIVELQCPNCFEYFEVDCYSAEELNKCPNCNANMKGEEK